MNIAKGKTRFRYTKEGVITLNGENEETSLYKEFSF
jgi:hypothetical protein